jgi:RNA polymerase sigma-70 factor (ECF subfamily)
MAVQKRKHRVDKPKDDEAELIRKAKQNGKHFGELYERYVRRIYTYIYYRTGNHEDAEDLTSRVFHKAFVHLPKYEHQGLPFSAWLYRIAHNTVANWYRDQGRRKVTTLEESTRHSAEEEPDAVAEKTAEKELLMGMIQRLPSERQQILILKFAEGYSNAEIGKILGRSEGAIKSLYHRTLLALREDLERQQTQRSKRRPRGRGDGE